MLLKGGEAGAKADVHISAFCHGVYLEDKRFKGSVLRLAGDDPNYTAFLSRYGERVGNEWNRIIKLATERRRN